MKRVAIVTPELLEPRSFFWDEFANSFKVRINNLIGEAVTQEEDGICVVSEGAVGEKPLNNASRILFVDYTAELPHLVLGVSQTETGLMLNIFFKEDIPELTLNDNLSEISQQWRENGAGTSRSIEIGNGSRLAYHYQDRIYVMDIYFTRSAGDPADAFVDVLINAKATDFPAPVGSVDVPASV